MNCDQAVLSSHSQEPAESGPAWSMPGLLLDTCIRPGESNEALAGDGSCFGGHWWQVLATVPCDSLDLPGLGTIVRACSCVIRWPCRKPNSEGGLSSPSSFQ